MQKKNNDKQIRMLTKMKLFQIFHINLDSKAPQILFKNGPKKIKKNQKKNHHFLHQKNPVLRSMPRDVNRYKPRIPAPPASRATKNSIIQ